MAERERSHTRPLGGVFVPHSHILSAADVLRALTRMAHEIVERNGGSQDLVLVGLQTGGVPLANQLAELVAEIEGGRGPRRHPGRGLLSRRHRVCARCSPRPRPTSRST